MNKKYIPNILTSARFPMAAACFYFALNLLPESQMVSLAIFITASITDFFDGYLARKWNIVSNFGKIADPIADKALTLGTMSAFWAAGVFPLWALIIIMLREISITVIRLRLLPKNIVLAAIYSGKLKTVLQITVLIVIYLFNILSIHGHTVEKLLILLTVIITVYSGAEFFVRNNRCFNVC